MAKGNTLVAPQQSVMDKVEMGIKSDFPRTSRPVKETVG
jgi:hypothetical protein